MKKALYIGLVALAAACGTTSKTASQDRAEVHQASQATASSGSSTGHHATGMVRSTGEGIGQAASSGYHGLQYGVHEVGQTLTGQQGDPASEARSRQYGREAEQDIRTSGHEFSQAGRETGRTAGAAGRTVYNAGRTGVEGTEQVVNDVRRSRGGGPNAVREVHTETHVETSR